MGEWEGHITNGKWRMSVHKFYAADSVYTVLVGFEQIAEQTTGKSNSGAARRRHQLRLGWAVSKSRNEETNKEPQMNELNGIELNWAELNEWMNVWCVVYIISSSSDACSLSMPYMWQNTNQEYEKCLHGKFPLICLREKSEWQWRIDMSRRRQRLYAKMSAQSSYKVFHVIAHRTPNVACARLINKKPPQTSCVQCQQVCWKQQQ